MTSLGSHSSTFFSALSAFFSAFFTEFILVFFTFFCTGQAGFLTLCCSLGSEITRFTTLFDTFLAGIYTSKT